MLSEELRNLALWMRTRQKFRALRDLSCDAYGVELAIERLDELAERAERLEAVPRLPRWSRWKGRGSAPAR
jgi:hypothetical protein